MRPRLRPVALFLALAPALALAFSVPPAPQRFLYDGASVLNGYQRQQIESRLMELNRQGQQVGVAILPSLDGESVEDATMQIAERWRPGFKTQDNGVVIAVFVNDRKMRIEVGYGLESRIPDSVARSIVMDQMRPAFRRGDYAGGITDAIESVAAAATGNRYRSSGRTTAIPIPGGYHFDSNQLGTGGFGGLGCCCTLLIAFVILRTILRSVFRPRGYGFGQQAMYRPSVPWWGWFLFGNAMGGGHRHHHHHHRSSGWFSGGGSGGWGGGGGG
ncbi:MAG TPA: TPM domain-containing protein, partial [Myxococcaceae bacterium]